MWNIVAKVLVAALAHADDLESLVGAVETEFRSVATGEGGVQKVQKAASATSALAQTVAKVAAEVAPAVAS